MLDDARTPDEKSDRHNLTADSANAAVTSRRQTAEAVSTKSTDASVAPKPTAFRGSMRKNLLATAGLVAFTVAAYFLVNWWTVGRYLVTTDDAYVGARAATLSPKVAGYVTEVVANDNASLKAGDVIARIDPGDYQLAIRSARDQIQTQRSTIGRIDKQIVAQQAMVDQARAQSASARAAFVKAGLDFKRQTELNARQINSAAALETSQANRDQASAAVASADAAVASAIANVAVYAGQRTEAENVLKQNETALAKAEHDLTFTEIRAPFDGVLGNRAVQVGDYVQPAQRLASLVPLQAVYIDANFKETQLSRVKVGQPVKIIVDAHASTVINGEVVSVAPASGSVFSLLPPDNATGNFTKIVQRVTVRIAVPAATASQSILRPGMSVVVSVDTKAPKPITTASTK